MYNILAVDDEQFNLDLIEATFMAHDEINLFFAHSGKEAIEQIQTHKIDVVLLDISMPVMDGIETLRKMRIINKTIPIVMVTANHEKKQKSLKAEATDFITKPYNIDELRLRTLNYAKLNQYTRQIEHQKEFLEDEVKLRTKDLVNALELAKETEEEIASRIGKVAEYRDLETGGHIKRMSHYSCHLAKLYGMTQEECDLVLSAAPLHDVGKVAIRDNILLKPGKFEASEFDIMKTHSEIGAQILEGAEKFPIIETGRIIALEHHEKYDGSGYPFGKKGDNISIYARIVAIADVFDALNSRRVYKTAMDLDTVLKIMTEGKGTHFDPILLDLFLENIADFIEIQKQFPDE
jgi:putative two-component system response regulator